ncbi:hypothetical protein TIFTF001_024610 [Ficus carica]|uniref:Uncharacterized protein n=1 Tax=Ficus carica TaxID=3494 RepID=A0AA88ANM4_FICCA|nr:hypothetical protein TIFTF001_024610 [Ficus carica]
MLLRRDPSKMAFGPLRLVKTVSDVSSDLGTTVNDLNLLEQVANKVSSKKKKK